MGFWQGLNPIFLPLNGNFAEKGEKNRLKFVIMHKKTFSNGIISGIITVSCVKGVTTYD